MKKNILGVAMFSMALALGLVFTGCGDPDGGPAGSSGSNTDGSGDNTSNGDTPPNGAGNNIPGDIPNMDVTALSSNSIEITWDTAERATSYEVWYEKRRRGESGWKTEAAIKLPATTNTSYTHNELAASTFYSYWVRPVNNDGYGEFRGSGLVQTKWGGGNLTVTGIGAKGEVWAFTGNLSTLVEVEDAIQEGNYDGKGYTASNSKTTWGDGLNAPADGTYTIIVRYDHDQVYKFTNISISGGTGTVSFNLVVGSTVGTNGRLK